MTINSTKIFISEKNLIHNMKYLTEAFGKKVLAVVKSNAYGHDINLVTKVLYKHGYREFAVARLVEAEKIITVPELKNSKILIFESIGREALDIIKSNPAFYMTANTFEELQEALDYGIPSEKIQIKIDFGFGRNGIEIKDIEKLKSFIEQNDLKFAGIYSHLFSVTYDEGIILIEKFNEIVNLLGKNRFEMIHLQNSAAVENFGSLKITTHIRTGMLIYGLQEEGFYDKNLKQVFSLVGKVAGIRNLENSNYLAYNLKTDLGAGDCKYTAKVKIGYGDGFLKLNQGTKCLIKNKEFNITLVTMDNSFIEVDSSVKEGDTVIFYPNQSLVIPQLRMTIYELLTILSTRLERILTEKL